MSTLDSTLLNDIREVNLSYLMLAQGLRPRRLNSSGVPHRREARSPCWPKSPRQNARTVSR